MLNFCFCAVVAAVVPMAGLQVPEKETNIFCKVLYSSDYSSKYYCFEYEKGYEIVNAESRIPIEYSYDAPSPYKKMSGNAFLYNGPLSYGVSSLFPDSDANILTTVNKKQVLKMLDCNSAILQSYRFGDSIYVENDGLLAGLNNFDRHDSNDKYNFNGSCGYLAAANILYYSKYRYNYDFIDDRYIEYVDGGRRYTAEFHDYLVQIGRDLGKGLGTTAFDIKDVMAEYCKRVGIDANHFAMLLSTPANIDSCIRDDKPVGLFGSFVSPKGGRTSAHAVTCYGVSNTSLGMGQTLRYFIVNYGWSGYSRVYLHDSLFENPVGSMYNMNY